MLARQIINLSKAKNKMRRSQGHLPKQPHTTHKDNGQLNGTHYTHIPSHDNTPYITKTTDFTTTTTSLTNHESQLIPNSDVTRRQLMANFQSNATISRTVSHLYRTRKRKWLCITQKKNC